MNCIDKVLTDEEIDNLVNEIMNIPIEKNNNCLSTYGSVNVDELISVVKEMQKIPTYDNLLKENQKLKKEKQELIKFLKKEKERLKRECSPIYENSLGKTILVNEDVYYEVNKILSKIEKSDK